MKKVLATFILSTFLLTPTLTSAQTQDTLLQQISELLKIVTQLQEQLAKLQGNGTRPPTAGAGLSIMRSLYIGIRGTDVTQLQTFLKTVGDFTYPEITGYYGNVTAQAVQRYQCREMQICSGTPNSNGYGVVGPKTRKYLNKGRGTTVVTKPTITPSTPTTPPPKILGGGGGSSSSTITPTIVPSQPQQNDCSLNGQEIKHGANTTAYKTNSVSFGQTCTSQTPSRLPLRQSSGQFK